MTRWLPNLDAWLLVGMAVLGIAGTTGIAYYTARYGASTGAGLPAVNIATVLLLPLMLGASWLTTLVLTPRRRPAVVPRARAARSPSSSSQLAPGTTAPTPFKGCGVGAPSTRPVLLRGGAGRATLPAALLRGRATAGRVARCRRTPPPHRPAPSVAPAGGGG